MKFDIMKCEIELYKVYQNPSKRKKYKLKELAPCFKYNEQYNNGVKEFCAILKLNNQKVISDYFQDKKMARSDCSQKALERLKIIDCLKYKKGSIKISSIIYFAQLLLIIIGFIPLSIESFYNYYYTLLTILYMVLVSPFFIQHYEIGICIGTQVIVRRTSIVENKFDQIVLYLSKGDYFLIRKVALPPAGNPNYFEAVISKDLILRSKTNCPKYPTYILPKNLGVGVNIDLNNKYAIRIVSFAKDGVAKTYVNGDVSQEYFTTNENFKKFYVFSKHGNHVVKERHFEISNLQSIYWYYVVLSIFYQYLRSKFRSNEYYKKLNKVNQFNNFKVIPGFDVNTIEF